MGKTLLGPNSMASRAEHSNDKVSTVDMRFTVISSKIYSGDRIDIKDFFDDTVTGSTNLYFITVGEVLGDAPSFDIEVYFNSGKIGDTITVSPAVGVAGKAFPVEITGLTDDQISFMTGVRLTCTTGHIDGNWSIYLAKKVVLG